LRRWMSCVEDPRVRAAGGSEQEGHGHDDQVEHEAEAEGGEAHEGEKVVRVMVQPDEQTVTDHDVIVVEVPSSRAAVGSTVRSRSSSSPRQTWTGSIWSPLAACWPG